MNIEEIIEKLQLQLNAIPSLQSKDALSVEFKKWHSKIQNIIERIPKKGEQYCRKFGTFTFRDYILVSPPNRELNHVKCYQEGLRSTYDLLESIIDELKEYPEDFKTDEPIEKNALTVIENVCNRFNLFVMDLHKKHHGKQTIEPIIIENEYDVQYLLQSILCLYFDDIRPEEPGNTRAGSSSRADFWLFPEKILIECKYIKSDFTREKLKEQLDKDLLDYRTKEGCSTVIFFVYDPKQVIENPRGFEGDYDSIPIESFTIKTLIRPTGR